MTTTTRLLTRTVASDGTVTETESDAVSSVEVGESAKGEFSIKSVKAYAATVEEAGRMALAEFQRLKKEMGA